MDIQDTRQQRLAQIMAEQFGGSIARLSDRLDRDPSYFSRIFSDTGKAGKKRIGETLARDIEAKLGLPRLWLDGDAQDAAAPPKEETLPPEIAARFARLINGLRNEDIDRMLAAIELITQVEAVQSVRKYKKNTKPARVLKTDGRSTAFKQASNAVHESGTQTPGKPRKKTSAS